MKSEDNLLKVMRASFRQELADRLLNFSQLLASLEDSQNQEIESGAKASLEPAQQQLITEMLRELHNLKGAARAVKLDPIEQLCHATEQLLSEYQSPHSNSTTVALVDKLYQFTSWGDQLLNLLSVGQELNLTSPALQNFISELLTGNGAASQPNPVQAATVIAEPALITKTGEGSPKSDQVRTGYYKGVVSSGNLNNESSLRINGQKLDELLAASTELLVARLRMRQHREALGLLLSETQNWLREWRQARPAHLRLAQRHGMQRARPTESDHRHEYARDKDLNNLLSFSQLNEQHLKHLETTLGQLNAHFNRDLAYLGAVTDQLQFETRRLRLLPLSLMVEELEHNLRQLARELGKQVKLVVQGAEIEVDKKIFDELKAPILHLLRNALDHGLESPALRLSKGKNATGTVTLSFHQSAGQIELTMRDDGAGIELERVREIALERGLITSGSESEIEPRTLLQLIFQPGFSTRSQANHISGRGIGLDAVREMLNRLGGTIEVESWSGQGTAFSLKIPNILVTTEGVVIKCNSQTFIVPVEAVVHSFRLSEVKVQLIGNHRYLLYKERHLPLVSLAEVLGITPVGRGGGSEKLSAEEFVIILQSREQYIAFSVDELLKNQEVVIKTLSKPLVRVRHIGGATIQANGQIALILNPEDLIGSALRSIQNSHAELKVDNLSNETSRLTSGSATPASLAARPKILVVDDSVTTRTLEKNILEGAGFEVQTASNGLEALTYLRFVEFDLVLTDLEMPQMNGLELIGAIKRDQRLLETPVVIVTSLDTAYDKTRGLQAGADAYLAKSRFDQEHLLATVRQLV